MADNSPGRKIAASLLRFGSAVMLPPISALMLVRSCVDYAKLRLCDFRPRPDDVFIATYPRSGTTWMQMILYQMTSDGEMNFGHITQVCPWFERAIVNGRDLEAQPSPRVFKTHLRFWLLPGKPCKHICVVRNGQDVAVSLFHFYRSHFGFKGDFAAFFKMFMGGKVEGGSWFTHVAGWWAHRNDSNVLFLRYEALSSDLEASVRKIAAFLDLEISPEHMRRILERSSFSFMKQYENQFDHTTEWMWEQGMARDSFLRKGKTGEGLNELSPEQRKSFDQLFDRKLGGLRPEIGNVAPDFRT